MANGTFTADIPGAVQRGLQFRQQAQLRPLQVQQAGLGLQQQQQKLQQAGLGLQRQQQQLQTGGLQQQALQQQIDQRTEKQKTQSLLTAALNVDSLPDNQIVSFLDGHIANVEKQGGDASASIKARDLAIAGNFEEVRSGAKNLIDIGVRQGDIEAPSRRPEELEIKRETLDVRKQEAGLRAAEAEERKLDRQLKRETNTIKRDELIGKIEVNKAKLEQAKRDTQFNAQSAIDAVGNSVGTIERMLKGQGLESAAGFQANFPTIAGSSAADFEATLETLQSQAFLSQIEKMKGLGALSENEGKKLGAALGSLNIEQSDKALRLELGRVKDILNDAKAKMEKKFNISTGELNEAELAELAALQAEFGAQ